MQPTITVLYYLITAAVTVTLLRNFLKSKDVQRSVLYALVLMPFVLRLLRIK